MGERVRLQDLLHGFAADAGQPGALELVVDVEQPVDRFIDARRRKIGAEEDLVGDAVFLRRNQDIVILVLF